MNSPRWMGSGKMNKELLALYQSRDLQGILTPFDVEDVAQARAPF